MYSSVPTKEFEGMTGSAKKTGSWRPLDFLRRPGGRSCSTSCTNPNQYHQQLIIRDHENEQQRSDQTPIFLSKMNGHAPEALQRSRTTSRSPSTGCARPLEATHSLASSLGTQHLRTNKAEIFTGHQIRTRCCTPLRISKPDY